MDVIEFKNVNYSRKGMKYPLNNIEFTVKQGDVVHLQGDNGQGKSTIIDFILGIRQPDSGEIIIFEEKPTDLRHKLITGASLQRVDFPNNAKLGSWVNFIESHYPKAKEKVTFILDIFSEDNPSTYDPVKEAQKELAGGEKTILSFALAQAGDPDLLIFDEPTEGLSLENRKKIWQTIQKLIDNGKTILFVCHDSESEIDIKPNKILRLEDGQFTIIERDIDSPDHLEKKESDTHNINVGLLHWLSLLFAHIKFNFNQILKIDKRFLFSLLVVTVIYSAIISFLQKESPDLILSISICHSLLLALITMSVTGSSIASERQDSNLTKILKIVPLPPTIYLTAKVLTFFLFSCIATLLILTTTIILSPITLSQGFILFFDFIFGALPFLFFGVALGYLFGEKEIQLVSLFSCALFIIPIYLGQLFNYVESLEKFREWVKWLNFGELISNYFGSLSPFYQNIQLVLYTMEDNRYDQYIEFHGFMIIWYIVLFFIIALLAYKNTVKKEAIK